jgi:hypothetical protein
MVRKCSATRALRNIGMSSAKVALGRSTDCNLSTAMARR